jgi:hypothetical protein
MIEVDLIDPSGPMIIAAGQADPAVWASIAAQATAYATQRGYQVDTGPLYNQPDITISSLGTFQNWLASQSDPGQNAKAPTQGGSSPTTLIVGGLVVAGLAGLLALALGARGR